MSFLSVFPACYQSTFPAKVRIHLSSHPSTPLQPGTRNSRDFITGCGYIFQRLCFHSITLTTLTTTESEMASSETDYSSPACGWGPIKPHFLQKFRNPKVVVVCFCLAGAIQVRFPFLTSLISKNFEALQFLIKTTWKLQ